MFGHQDDKDDNHDGKSPHEDTATPVIAPDNPEEVVLGAEPTDQPHQADDSAPQDAAGDDGNADAGTNSNSDSDNPAPAAEPAPEPDSDDAWQHPGEPLDKNTDDNTEDNPVDTGPEPINDIIAPPGGGGAPSFKPPHLSGSGHGSSDEDNDNTPHELIDIKQKALTELAPLMGKLDQGPEDKFRTLMMMIQSSDDQSLIKLAYETAEAINDEKAKAQALLDIVNEINYFTQHPAN